MNASFEPNSHRFEVMTLAVIGVFDSKTLQERGKTNKCESINERRIIFLNERKEKRESIKREN